MIVKFARLPNHGWRTLQTWCADALKRSLPLDKAYPAWRGALAENVQSRKRRLPHEKYERFVESKPCPHSATIERFSRILQISLAFTCCMWMLVMQMQLLHLFPEILSADAEY